jgi:hypothetical protein
MDNFDFTDRPQPSSPNRSDLVWNILTIVTLVATACVGLYFLLVFINPSSSLNPLPPGPESILPTPTTTPIQLQPTWTPSPTIEVTPSVTPRPTWTPIFTDTPFSLVPATITPTPTATPKAPFSASVNAIESSIIPHLQEAGCNWFGVGGTVDDQNNSPIIGVVVRLGGTLNGHTVEYTTVSGVSPDYGKSGFEFTLGELPTASQDSLYVILLDQAGLPLSEKVYFDTSSDCKKNLTLIRFKKVR